MVIIRRSFSLAVVGYAAIASQCPFDYMFKKSLCCDSEYQGECPLIPTSCCEGYDVQAEVDFEGLQWTTINPGALTLHVDHLLATKRSIHGVFVLLQWVRVRAHLELLAAHGRMPQGNYLADVPESLLKRWNNTRYAQSDGAFDWPMRVRPGTPSEFRSRFILPLARAAPAISSTGDLLMFSEKAKLAQNAFERLVMWDQWLRAVAPFGPPPRVRLYTNACCTQHDLVGHLLSMYRSPTFAIVGEDPSDLARLAHNDFGASVLLALSEPSADMLNEFTVLPRPPDLHVSPQFPRAGREADPATLVPDDSVDVVFIALRSFADYFVALGSWLPKLKLGGAMVGFWVLTTSELAAAMYIFASQRGIELRLATHRCAFIVKS
ncbi:unnamed protein product [Prorocentrum cordatum]|uniref:Uncharacterized protein n=1 Tax=Prorocentrum cordatum TaxID=2364126 RepID=A0ABN9XUI9_9DINO|nr:unnamed protein product [Polarella glacialis]